MLKHKSKVLFRKYTSNSPLFQITIDTRIGTSETDATFVLPTVESYFNYPEGTVNRAIVDWGDGTEEEELENTPGNILHTYPEPGIYQISARGNFRDISFYNYPESAPKLLSIDNWGRTGMRSANFKGCINMVGKFKDKYPTEVSFEGCTLFNREPKWYGGSLRTTFKNCISFKQTLARLNIIAVTNMNEMCANIDINEPGTTANYDSSLIKWSNNLKPTMKYNVPVNFGYSKYSESAQEARDFLINTMNWHFIDGGKVGEVNNLLTFTIDTRKESFGGTAYNTRFMFSFSGNGFDVTIHWGDNTTAKYVSGETNPQHYYNIPGVYRIKVEGIMPRFPVSSSIDGRKVISLDNWGTNEWQDMYKCFDGFTNMEYKYTDIPNTASVENFQRMFINNVSFNEEIKFSTANATDISSMFEGCTSFNQKLSPANFITDNVRYMERTFYGCVSFKQSLADFNISNVFGLDSICTGCDINEPGTTTNYDETLISWANQNPRKMLRTDFGDSKYSAVGEVARNILINDKQWEITDGGLQV